VGFPQHAFNYEENISTPNSFYEFLLQNKILGNSELVSLDEYVRPSKFRESSKISNNIENVLSANRLILTKNTIRNKLFNIFRKAGVALREYKGQKIPFSFFHFIFFCRQFNFYSEVCQVLNKLKTRNNIISGLYFLSFTDQGLFKYLNNEDLKISVFSYSQNLFTPPANYNFQVVYNNSIEEISDYHISECDASIFSLFFENAINCNFAISHFNNLKIYLNNKYSIDLRIYTLNDKFRYFANLGYEGIEILNIPINQVSVIIFDVPIESYIQSLGNNFCGDITMSKDFIENFYCEIFKFLKMYKYQIYIKPKYALIENSEYYLFICELANKFGDNIHVINPYSKLKTQSNLFSGNINFTYTSTTYTMKHLTYSSFFYVPEKYSKIYGNSENQIAKGSQILNFLNTK
jgi:hypothetical protein